MSPRTTFHMFCTAVLFATALAALPGCDLFLVCENGRYPECTGPAQADGSTAPTDGSGMVDLPPPAMERAFELRATLPLDSKTKFAGLYGTDAAVILHDDSTSTTANWLLYQQKINLSQFNFSIQACASCPDISKINPKPDEVRIAGSVYYLLSYQTQTLYRLTGQQTIQKVDDVVLPTQEQSKLPPYLFSHPSLNALATANIPHTNSAMFVYPKDKLKLTDNGDPNTRFVIGDLDDIEPIGNGYEFIIFSGKNIKTLQHELLFFGSKNDLVLINKLQAEIDSTKYGDESAIDAAFIANLNSDSYAEFIYVRSGKVYAASYRGYSNILNGKFFEGWNEPLIRFTGNASEVIKSIVAADLTADGYPELILETNQAVYFYLNNLKP